MLSKTRPKTKRSLYSEHPSYEYARAILANLPEKTGKSIDEWLKLVNAEKLTTANERIAWLKKEHGLGLTTAHLIAECVTGEWEKYDPEALVAAMFAGPKAGLVPLYERLLSLGLKIGADVRACPCKTIVPLYRRHVFAEIKPTTRTRIDLGLALRDAPVEGRLIDTGGFAKKDRITHRIPIAALDDIDDEVERWLRKAYDLDA
jgi:hypothetical protein